MSPYLYAAMGIFFIFFCTTLGSSFVFFFRKKEISPKINQIFLGFAAGIMLSASIFSLIVPSLEMEIDYLPSWIVAGLALLLGAFFLWGIDKLVPHFHIEQNKEEGLPSRVSKTGKMFLAVTIHNIPEGLSVGISFGVALAKLTPENQTGLLLSSLMLAVGIGIQNIPEGAVVSLPIKGETGNSSKAFWFGTLSGAVEPIAAVLGLFLAYFLEPIMPWALSFAAGCMLYVIAEEMIPDAKGDPTSHSGVWAFIIGFVLMMSLDVALG